MEVIAGGATAALITFVALVLLAGTAYLIGIRRALKRSREHEEWIRERSQMRQEMLARLGYRPAPSSMPRGKVKPPRGGTAVVPSPVAQQPVNPMLDPLSPLSPFWVGHSTSAPAPDCSPSHDSGSNHDSGSSYSGGSDTGSCGGDSGSGSW